MESSKEVKLLGSQTSPFVFRIKCALKLKGINYEYIQENVWNKSPLLLESNPIYKKVPVLIHNGKAISESLVILEYIEDTWKQNPILPQDPYEKATARFWAKFAEGKLVDCIKTVLVSEGEEQEKAQKQAHESLSILEWELKDKKYFGGDTLGYVDIVVLGCLSHCLETIEEVANVKIFNSQSFPFLSKLTKEFGEISLFSGDFPSKNELFGYYQKARQISLATKASR